jgi:SAM-dependent methyltransferase
MTAPHLIDNRTGPVAFQGMTTPDLLALMRAAFGERAALNIEAEFPVTGAAFAALSADDVRLIERGVAVICGGEDYAQLKRFKQMNPPHYRREILRYGCTFQPELLSRKTGMTAANPPLEIHSMMRQQFFAGDLYSGDMIVSSARRGGFDFAGPGRYLDFGCSSAALTRNMAAAFPHTQWFGCDPRKSSIAWATANFPNIQFCVNAQNPPLGYDTASFAGAYAVSIWSHFSEKAALRWFAEMRRIIKPGGFLVFTTHGLRSVYSYLEAGQLPNDISARVLATLLYDSFVFEPFWTNDNPDVPGHDMSDWGNAFFTVEWVLRSLPAWRLMDYQPGLSQSNQDVYTILRR